MLGENVSPQEPPHNTHALVTRTHSLRSTTAQEHNIRYLINTNSAPMHYLLSRTKHRIDAS